MLIALFRLIRLPNLLVVGLTQWLVANRVLGQAFKLENITPVLSPTELGFLILSTILVTAMGYVINDLIDEPIDRINRPEQLIVGRGVSRRGAYQLTALLGLTGFATSWYLASLKGELEWLWLYPFFAGLLLLYPRYLKRHYLTGNIFVAVACAATAGLIWLAERDAWSQLSDELSKQSAQLILIFMLYAFVSTWIREIVKDLEDQEGDRHEGRLSLPLDWGDLRAKQVIWILSTILFFAIGGLGLLAVFKQLMFVGKVLVPALLLLVLLLSKQLKLAENQEAYYRLSQHWKFFFLGGLCLLLCYQLP